MTIDFDSLKSEVAGQIKEMISGLTDDVRDLEPTARAIAADVVSYATQAAAGKDVSVAMLHLRAQAQMLAGMLVTRVNARLVETLQTIAEVAARVLGVALKGAL